MKPPKLPSLLIIGAMKSGTTTLYMDLADHAGVYPADNKEPHSLCHDAVLDEAGLAEYASLYKNAADHQTLCDASTGYTKLPDHPGVVERALRVLPEGFKAIYIVRNPVDRAISHYRHKVIDGSISLNPNRVLREDPAYVAYSRYAWQLRPWIDGLGAERVCVVKFEDYTSRREETLRRICGFLEAAPPEGVDGRAKVYNKTDGKSVPVGVWKKIQQSAVYQHVLRPLMPVRLRLALQQAIVPPASNEHEPITDETRRWLADQLRDDAAELAAMVGEEPFWPELAEPPEQAAAE